MKYKQARSQLEYALKHQKTINVSKLKLILQAMNVGLDDAKSREVTFLKREIKNRGKRIKQLEKKLEECKCQTLASK